MWWSLMCAPNFRSIGPTVQSAERIQTHTQTVATKNITSSANTGGKNYMYMYSIMPLLEGVPYLIYSE